MCSGYRDDVRLTQQFNQSLEHLSSRARVDSVSCRSLTVTVPSRTGSSSPGPRRKRRTHPNHSPFPPSLPRFFILPFLIISRLFPSSDNTYRQKAANHAVAIHAPLYLIFISPLYAYPFSIQFPSPAPRGRLYDTKHRHCRQVARMYCSYSSSRASSFSIEKSLFLSPFISYSLVCFPRSRRPLCGTAVHGISAALSCVFSRFLSLSPAWMILSPSQQLS